MPARKRADAREDERARRWQRQRARSQRPQLMLAEETDEPLPDAKQQPAEQERGRGERQLQG
jgi:hypothetical protein